MPPRERERAKRAGQVRTRLTGRARLAVRVTLASDGVVVDGLIRVPLLEFGHARFRLELVKPRDDAVRGQRIACHASGGRRAAGALSVLAGWASLTIGARSGSGRALDLRGWRRVVSVLPPCIEVCRSVADTGMVYSERASARELARLAPRL